MVGFSFSMPKGLTDPIRSLTAFAMFEGDPSDSLEALAERMIEAGCSALPVRMPDRRLGIVTERDIVRAVAQGATDWGAAALASMPLVRVQADQSIDDAAELMITSGIRHLIVEDDEQVGIVSMRDILDAMLSESRT